MAAPFKGFVALYPFMFTVGIILPLYPFVCSFFWSLNVGPAQFNPAIYEAIFGHYVLWKCLGIQYDFFVNKFRRLYQINSIAKIYDQYCLASQAYIDPIISPDFFSPTSRQKDSLFFAFENQRFSDPNTDDQVPTTFKIRSCCFIFVICYFSHLISFLLQ